MAATMAALLAGHANANAQADPGGYKYRILANPTSGDEFGFRGAMQQYAQGRSDKLFGALSSLLGGSAPKINFVPDGSRFTANHMSANITDSTGAPVGTINMDPLTVDGLIEDGAPAHNVTVNQMPHEMAHLRQLASVLADVPTREGGAQAFADYVTPTAAVRAGIPYTPGNFDGSYADYVKQAQTRGLAWLLAGQFGNTGSPQYP